MKNKILIYLLFFFFLCGIGVLVYAHKTNVIPSSISLPLPKLSPTPAEELITPSPTPVDPYLLEGKQLLEDLGKIEEDLPKAKSEDTRLLPADFLFDSTVSQ